MSKAAIIKLFKALPVEQQEQTVKDLAVIIMEYHAARLKVMRQETERMFAKHQSEKKTRAKPQPTHRSKKNRKLTWTGRGSMPRWMREEMKALKLKPDAFLLKK